MLACHPVGWYLRAVTLQDRRRFERALHDGTQQDLIAISVRLQLLRDAIERDPGAVGALIDELEHDTRAALERVRALAADIFPAILDARGLPDALHGIGVRATGVGRHAPDVEAAVYFFCRACAEAGADVRLTESPGALVVEVHGPTPDPTTRELVERVGGTVESAGDDHVRAIVPRR